jgi:hypothetical protein
LQGIDSLRARSPLIERLAPHLSARPQSPLSRLTQPGSSNVFRAARPDRLRRYPGSAAAAAKTGSTLPRRDWSNLAYDGHRSESRGKPPQDPQSQAGEGGAPVFRVGLPTLPFCFRNRSRVPRFAAGDRWRSGWGREETGTSGTDAEGTPRSRPQRAYDLARHAEVSPPVLNAVWAATRPEAADSFY